MKFLRLVVSVILVIAAVLPAMAGCGGSSDSVQDVHLGFSEAAVIGTDGQAEFTVGDDVDAVASIVYFNGGSAKGEWQIDGKTIPVTFDLPEPTQTGNSSVIFIHQNLPTETDGLHTVNFKLTSPDTFDTGKREYVLQNPPPPANPTSYIVRLRVLNGVAERDNESGLNWHDELRLLVGTKVWIPANKDNLPPLDTSLWTAVLPPNGDDFAIQDKQDDNYEPGMDEFDWNKDVTPDLLVDSGKGVTFRTQLWEKDANLVAGIFKAISYVFTKSLGMTIGWAGAGPVGGFTVGQAMYSGISKLIDLAGSADDFIGEQIFYFDSAYLGLVYAEGGTRTIWAPYRGDKGEFTLNYVITVQQRNVPAPSGSGVYVIQEFVQDGFSVSGGDTEGGNEELRLARIAGSTGGGQGVYSPPGTADVDVQDGEVFLWTGAVSEPVRVVILDNGECWVGDRAVNPVDLYYSSYNLYEEDPSNNENFGTSSLTLSKAEIQAIADSPEGFRSFVREFTDNNGRDILMDFEIQVRKQPLSERYVVQTFVEGGTNIMGGNTEAGKEEFRLTATDVNNVSTVYSPPDGDIDVDDDGTNFAWSGALGTVQIDPIGNGQYGVAGTPVAADSMFLMNYSLWEEDNSNPEEFGTVRHRLSLDQLNNIIAGGGEFPVTSTFEGPNGTISLNFRIVVTKEVNIQ